MPKLPIITSKKLLRILEKLGFQLDHTTGSHFICERVRAKLENKFSSFAERAKQM